MSKITLRDEILSEVHHLIDGIHGSYEYPCTCGTYEGELNCKHCNKSMSAINEFEKRLKELMPEDRRHHG